MKRILEKMQAAYQKTVKLQRLANAPPSNNKRKATPAAELSALLGLDYARFSHLLPYRYYDADDNLFINQESIGFGLELAPLSGANEEIIHHLSQMIKEKIDPSWCVQVMLVADNKIGDLLSLMQPRAPEDDPMMLATTQSQIQYFAHAATSGFDNKRKMCLPLRNYRSFMFVSKRCGYKQITASQLCELRSELTTELTHAGIANIELDVVRFLTLLRSLINRNPNQITTESVKHDDYQELHEQIVDPSFGLTVEQGHLSSHVGHEKTDIISLSIKSLPEQLMLWSGADYFANILKPGVGIPCPFVISVHFKCEPVESSKLKAFGKARDYEKKANSPYAKLIPGTAQAAYDWKKIRDDLASGDIQLCKAYYNCVLFTEPDHKREQLSQAIAAFRISGMDLYVIKYQQLQSYLSLMPFVVEEGLWHDLQFLGRLNTMTSWNLTNLLPLIAEYKGNLNGQGVLAPTFRHQAAFIDIFNPSLDNYNTCITATSGAGKSVLSQSIIASVLADGGKVWVIDLGQSYKKFCKTLGGTYLSVSNLALNPFSKVTDISICAESIRDLIAVMASPQDGLNDVQKAYLLDAVIDAFKAKGNKANIDDVIDNLSLQKSKEYDLRANDIVTLLKKYSPKYAQSNSLASRVFNEASMLESDNFARERFVVLELGELENQPDLLKAVLFALMLDIELQMYQGNQDRKKLCVIDEAWRLLSGSNKTAAAFIEKGFRTARKHKGSFMTITQSIKDFYSSAEAGAAWSCAENKIIMRQNEKAFKDFLSEHPDYFSEYEKTLIKNFKGSAENGFSEFMAQLGRATSFHRLFLSPFTRVMYSSRAEEHQAVEQLVKNGMSMVDAIKVHAENLYGSEIDAIEKGQA